MSICCMYICLCMLLMLVYVLGSSQSIADVYLGVDVLPFPTTGQPIVATLAFPESGFFHLKHLHLLLRPVRLLRVSISEGLTQADS